MRDTTPQQLMSEEVVNRMSIAYELKTISADQDKECIPFRLIEEYTDTSGMVRSRTYSVVTNGERIDLLCDHRPFYYRPYRRGWLRCLECGGYKGGISSDDEYVKYYECVKKSGHDVYVEANKIIQKIESLHSLPMEAPGRIVTYRGDHVKDPVHVKNSLMASDWGRKLAKLEKENKKIEKQIFGKELPPLEYVNIEEGSVDNRQTIFNRLFQSVKNLVKSIKIVEVGKR